MGVMCLSRHNQALLHIFMAPFFTTADLREDRSYLADHPSSAIITTEQVILLNH
jgi:hypothetical protein